MKTAYINYKKLSVRYDLENNCFSAIIDSRGEAVKNAKLVAITDKKGVRRELSEYGAPIVSRTGAARIFGGQDSAGMAVVYPGVRDAMLIFTLSDAGIRLTVGTDNSATYEIEGELNWGAHDQADTMAACVNRAGDDLRVASGPATSAIDDSLFDPDTDSALQFKTAGNFRMKFDWEKRVYTFKWDNAGAYYGCELLITPRERVYEGVFNMDYKKMNPDTTFKTPPVGWMTWYAVQFEAGEKTVYENAEFQKKHLKKYGADTVWVDWEWYHRDFSGVGDSDVDMFHPDPKTYPNGLKKVADKISKLGFTPAIWVGPTNDPTEDELIKAHPEAIMRHKPDWCGQYFYDVTHPVFLEETLPKMLNQVVDWGYKAVKWDCLPHTMTFTDEEIEKLYAKGISTREALLGAYKKAREILGENYYMLYCCALSQRDIDLAVPVFDAARIGGDIFRWDEFLSELIDKLYKYYAFHNVVMLADPDNVVIREKFNTIDQARTRAAIVSMMGLPFTLGDNLPELGDERVEIIKRSIPPIPRARPMDIRTGASNRREMRINLAVERPFGSWNVLDIVNLAEENVEMRVDIAKDLHIDVDEKQFFVYDFWGDSAITVNNGSFTVNMNACESKLLSIVTADDAAKVVSTSRHISHGAIDLLDVTWNPETHTLSGVSKVVPGEDYSIVVASPALNEAPANYLNATTTTDVRALGGRLYKLTWKAPDKEKFEWSVGFVKGGSQE